jgi:hypothetical protein
MDTAKAKEAAERIVRLLAEPEPGLYTWNLFLATAVTDLDKALGMTVEVTNPTGVGLGKSMSVGNQKIV